MIFDIDKFGKIVKEIYDENNYFTFSYEDVMSVFDDYFGFYEFYMHAVHPPIKKAQIKKIMLKMPICEDLETDDPFDLEPYDYHRMIKRYFNTVFQNCNYNINHFFSGKIRAIKYYEVLHDD